MKSAKPDDFYLIPVLLNSIDVLALLEHVGQPISLEEIRRETLVAKSTVFRIMKTLVHRGYISETPNGLYRRVTQAKKPRFGYAQMSAELPFSCEVTESIKEAAKQVGVDLMILDNALDGPTAWRNAEEFVKAGVDLVIEFQRLHEVSPAVAGIIADAKIPLIAIDVPHPQSVYFGVDNYRVGCEVGELLSCHAKAIWKGSVELVIGLDVPEAGLLVQSRISGAFEVIRNRFPTLPPEAFVRLNVRGLRDRTKKSVARFLERNPDARRILIAAVNDSCALGALEAVRAAGRQRHVAIVGQDCIVEAVEEMRNPHSPLVGSISHETDSYGSSLMLLGLNMLAGKAVPPHNYVKHRVVMRRRVTKLA